SGEREPAHTRSGYVRAGPPANRGIRLSITRRPRAVRGRGPLGVTLAARRCYEGAGGSRRVPQVSLDQVRGTFKPRDSWWTVLFVDPLAARLVRVLAPRAWITPTLLTVVAFVLGLGAAAAFLAARPAWWVAGAVAYYVACALDCVDGKIDRLLGQGYGLGAWRVYDLYLAREYLSTYMVFAGACR